MKKLLIAGAAAIALVAVLALALLSNLDSLVAKAIEKHGSDATQTRVQVSGVDISLRQGRGSVRGLRVESPEGFESRTAFSLEDVSIDIDVKSVREDPLVIDEIRIQTPVVNAEVTKTGASNIETLRKQMQSRAAARARDGGDAGGKIKRIRIEKLVVEKGSVNIDASALGLEKRTIALPPIRLADIGGADGAPSEEIARIILTAVTKNVSSEIAGSEVNRLIAEKLKGSLADKAKGLLEKITN